MMYTQLEQRGMPQPPVNVSTLREMKANGDPIACLTAYDASYLALAQRLELRLLTTDARLAHALDGLERVVLLSANR